MTTQYADVLKVRYTVLRHLVGDPQTLPTLEVFLRGLYASYLRHRDEQCTGDLFCTLLEDGFTGDPALFDPAWARYLGELGTGASMRAPGRIAPRERFERLILRKIADLHAMTPEWLENIEQSMGGAAPSGQTWKHSDLAAFLDMASRAPELGFPRELGRGRERYDWGEVAVAYMEKPEQELARLEALVPFDGPEVIRPSGEDDEPQGGFGWDDIADFLWLGQIME
jgi:hypothetical protein